MKTLTCLLCMFLLFSFRPDKDVGATATPVIQWMSWEEAVKANQTVQKKFLVDVYTDWCGWCKVMDRKTFSDPVIASYVNEHFYAVKLDAEQKETIVWREKEFKWIDAGRNGIHALAYSLLDGQMSYPSFVFLTEDFKRIRISKGFKDADSFIVELKFAVEENYKKETNDRS